MKKIVFVVMMLLAVAFTNAMAEEAIISGYAPKDFAIKGEVAEQLDKIAETIKSADKPVKTIEIIGSADITGVDNDEWGLKRAKNIEAYLTQRFPEAKVNGYSRGSELNARQVKIVYTFAKTITPVTQEKNNKLTVLLFVIAGAIAILLFVFGRQLFAKQESNQETKPVEVKAKKSFAKFVPLEENGVYEAQIEYDAETDRWFTPFRNTNNGERIYAENENRAKKSVQRCWKNREKFGEQIDKLLSEKDDNKKKIRQI